MIITFARSSSLSTHEICPHKFYLEYILGVKSPSGKAASKGNVVHKALEVLAHVSMCVAAGTATYEDDTFGTVSVAEATPDWALAMAWDHYVALGPDLGWERGDHTDCRKWLDTALTFHGGRFDPRNMDVVEPEQRFDFAIEEPWAHYRYELHDGQVVEGQFGIKGTMDLVVRSPHDPDILEIVDWKTGQRKDWSQEGWAKKTYDEVCDDPQFRLYHYAASRLYPDAGEIFATVFYLKDGGPYSIPFTREDLPRTEQMLREKFEEIRDTKVPLLRIGRRCTTFCHFGTHASPHDPSRTICQFMADKVREQGIERATHEYGVPGAYGRYGSGGGKQDTGE